MTTHTDLRAVLDRHAHDLDGLTPGDRLGQVHGRIRTVRRNRRAGVAAAAAVVVAAVAGLTFLPDQGDPQPADRIAGHDVPPTMASLGYTYSHTSSHEGVDRVRLRLPESDQPRLVAWASETGSVDLTVGGEAWDAGADDFGGFDLVHPWEHPLVVAEGEGRIGLAVYTLSGPAPGHTVDGITYRDRVASDRLVGAVIGDDPGQTDLTLEFTMPETLRKSSLCLGAPAGYQVNLELNGDGVSHGRCDDTQAFDPGSHGGVTFTDGLKGVEPGDRVTARVWLTAGNGDDLSPSSSPVGLDRVRLGLGLYSVPPGVRTVAGWNVPELVEFDGHTWAFADSYQSERGGATSVKSGFEVLEPSVATTLTSGHGTVCELNIDQFGGWSTAVGGAGGPEGILWPGSHSVDITCGKLTPDLQVGYAIYGPAE